MVTIVMPWRNEGHDALTYVSNKVQQALRHCSIEHPTDISNNPIGQTLLRRSKYTLKRHS